MSAQGEDRSDFQAVMPPTDRTGRKLDFIIYKATEGTSWRSQTYAQNIALAKQAGVPFGSYHFFHPGLPVAPQVALFMSYVAEHGGLERGAMLMADSEISFGIDGELSLFSNRSHLLETDANGVVHFRDGVDVGEYPRHLVFRSRPKGVDRVSVDLGTREFLLGVRAAVEVALGGDYCQEIVYSYLSMLPQLASCTDFPLNVAYYSNSAPPSVHPWSDWIIWQFAGGGGRGGSDQDGFQGGAAQFNKWRLAKTGPTPPPGPQPNWTELLVTELPVLAENASATTPNDDVKSLQGLLIARGFAPGAADGFFGAGTLAQVKAFQTAKGLTPDGVVGQLTWPKLLNR